MSGPDAGESYEQFRARRLAEMSGQPAPSAGFEEAKKAVAAKQAAKSARLSAPPAGKTNIVSKLDTAAVDEDERGQAHKRLAGGVKPLDMEAIKAADKDKSWHSKPEAEQVAEAKSAPASKPAGVSYSTSTPGAANQTAMAAAMAKAGVSAPAEAPAAEAKPAAKSPAVKKTTIAPEVAARNNMAAPRGINDTSVVSGVTAGGSQAERDRARAAATKGSRGSGNKAAEEAAARASTRRSAASSGPAAGVTPPNPPMAFGGQFGSSRKAEAFAHVLNLPAGPSSKLSDKPAAAASAPAPAPVNNPAPHAPTPVSNASPAAPSAPTTQPSGPLSRENVIGSKPEKGVSPAHMVSSAPGRDWLTPQAANRAKAKAPKAAVTEEPALAASPTPKKEPAAGRKAPSSAAAVGGVNRSAMPSGHDYQGAVASVGSQPQRTQMAAPQAELAHAGAVSGFSTEPQRPLSAGRTRTPAAGPSGTVGGGRSGAAPRSAEVGGGRVSSGAAGGLHIANEGNDNHFENIGNVTHNTTIHNYGTMTGNSIGNAGGAPRGPGAPRSGGGGGEGGGHAPAAGTKFNAWYSDSTGHHDLRKGLDHITGRTGGSGEKLDKTRPVVGGSQRPLKGSVRSTATAAPQQAASSTGTTHNWTGPVHQSPTSASGNGTAQHNPVP